MKRQFVNRILVVICAALILLNEETSTAAQQVKIIKRASTAGSSGQMGKLPTAHPKPLSTAQKLQAVQFIVSRRGKKADSLIGPLLLTPVKLVSGPARLTLIRPTFVEANSGVPRAAFIAAEEEKISVEFTPPATGFYLVDFAITGGGPFTLSGSGDVQSSSNQDLSEHLVFVIDVTQANKTIGLGLEAQGMWMFYSCEISRIQ